tara:strand:- start:680 stop:1042 length:363 start_codon:yes stop_codon:yes gene_type:complete
MYRSFTYKNSFAEEMKSMWEKLKTKWGVESNIRMTWIFVIFAITGTSITFVRKPLTIALFEKSTYGELSWWQLTLTIVMVYFIYQIFLFVIGSLLGEYKFVKWFVLKMNKRMFPFLRNIS